jgi:hypothetical protein
VRLCQLGSVTLWPSPPWFLSSLWILTHTLLFLVCVCTELDSACSGNWLTWFCVLTLELLFFFFFTNIYFSFLQYIGYLLFVFIKKNLLCPSLV